MTLSGLGATPPAQHHGVGLLVGMGVSGTAFGLVLSVVGRAAPEARRTQAMGLVSALGAGGQVLTPLLAQQVTAAYGWQAAILATGGLLAPMALAIPFLGARRPRGAATPPPVALGPAIRGAFAQPS